MSGKRFFYIIIFSILFFIAFYFFVTISFKNINVFIYKQEIDALIIYKEPNIFVPESSSYEINYTFYGEVYFAHFSSNDNYNSGERIKILVSRNNPNYFMYHEESFWIDPVILLFCCLVIAIVLLIILRKPEIVEKFGDSFPSS